MKVTVRDFDINKDCKTRQDTTNCTQCKEPLSEPVPQDIDGQPYCAECSWECAECSKPFIVKYIDDILCPECYDIEK
ncbi:hypothetical protein LCGC14_2403350 [marine sediment metagenome]|uniref:LIM zinc-binding domain-containing protein n=1 Tax=marine sediment metagenome TaxID=412755 RepID=A0A0F9E6Y3_9ZZZZ